MEAGSLYFLIMSNRLNTLLPAIFLSLFISRAAIARAQYYQYNGNLPFVEMMLDMMTAMGMLDKIPPQFMANGYGGYNGLNYYNNLSLRNALLNRGGWNSLALSSPGLNLPNLNLLGLNASGLNPYGINPYGLNPYSMSPYSMSPYGMSPYGMNGLSLYNSRGVNPLWASPWLASSRPGSPWNNIWLDSFPQRPRYTPFAQSPMYPYAYPYSGRRPVRPVSTPLARRYHNRSDPARYAQPVNTGNAGRWRGSDNFPCVTEFCGLLPPQRERADTNPALALDGLWETNSGEKLGIKNNHFLWSDGGSRYLTGTIRVLRSRLIANVDGNANRVMQYRYRIENNRLFTRGPNGLVRIFTRVPVNE